jgi:hypothetical protein
MILTAAEARIALGLHSSITDQDRSLIEMLLPLAQGIVVNDPRGGLHYSPEQEDYVKFYPRAENAVGGFGGVVWDTNQAGTKAYATSLGRNLYLQLADLPVRSISEIRVDYEGGFGQIADTFGDSTIQVAGDDYYQELSGPGLNMTGHVISRVGWPVEPGTVKVSYTAGYSALELAGRAGNGVDASPIKHATLLTLIKAFRTIKANQKQALAGFTAGPITSEHLGDYSYSAGSSAAMLTGLEVSMPPEAALLLQPFRHYGIMML